MPSMRSRRQAAGTAASGARDPWWDNAKMALVTLVVVGHSWTLLPSEGATSHLYDFLYSWHMPAFVLVTGYLSRGFSYSPERMWKLVRTVAVPYVVFEAAMALFRIYIGGEDLDGLFADPHWPMWFLAALFFWRLATPIFRALPGGLAVAVAISLAAGMWAGNTLDIARVLGLLPFFVLGLKATPERLEWLRGRFPAMVAVGVFVGLWFITADLDRWASTEWLYYRSQYGDLGVSDGEAFLIRAALLVAGTAGALAFFALVPRLSGRFTAMGAWTLEVYLFHGFVVKGLSYTAYPEWAADHVVASLVLTTIGGVVGALVLAAPPVARLLHHLVDPFGTAEGRVDHAVALTATTVADAGPEPAGQVADTEVADADTVPQTVGTPTAR